MMKLKKISALVLAIMMIAAVGLAYAEETKLGADQDGVAGNRQDTGAAQTNSVLILKELKIYNTTGEDIYLPTVGYDYTIATATVTNEGTDTGAKITDMSNPHHEGYVYSGDADALTTTTAYVDFSASTTVGYNATGASQTIAQPTAAAATGTSYYGGFSVAFNPAKFDHPGIFRYVITEAEDSTNTLAKAGVVHQDSTAYTATRFLDVYVRRAVSTDTDTERAAGYVIYGYVVFTGTKDTSITYADESAKTNGYVAAKGGDEYNTYNLIVKKTISGALAEKNHQFPFRVVFSSPNATAATIYYKAVNGIPAAETTASLSNTGLTIGALTNSSTLKLTDNGTVTFYGIPAGVTATVQENNDTFDIYTASATIIDNSSHTYIANQVQSKADATISAALDNATTTTQVGTADTEMDWTNTISIVSPTGYVARFAPYALMLAAGIALFVILMAKRHKHTDED